MTLPIETIDSIRMTREFLRDLMDRNKTPKLPLKVRRQAGRCLRHYPFSIYEKAMLQGILDNRGGGDTPDSVGYREAESTVFKDYDPTPPYWWTRDTVKVRNEDVPLSDFDPPKEDQSL